MRVNRFWIDYAPTGGSASFLICPFWINLGREVKRKTIYVSEPLPRSNFSIKTDWAIAAIQIRINKAPSYNYR